MDRTHPDAVKEWDDPRRKEGNRKYGGGTEGESGKVRCD